MKIYIVSLIKDKEKRQTISSTLDNMGLEYNFVDAIYGKDLNNNILDSLEKKGKILRRGYEPTPGEIGCAFSHLKAMEEIVTNKENWVCILEDDVLLDNRFREFILKIKTDSLCEEDLYLLGGQNGLITEKFISKSFLDKKVIGNQKFYKIIKSEKSVNRACCYLVNKKFAKNYIKYAKNNFFLADDWKQLQQVLIFDKIYLSNFVDHPIDLTNSNIEKERLAGEDKRSNFKKTKVYKIIRYFYFCLRIFQAQLKRFLG